MLSYKHLNVSAKFNTGDFLGVFSVHCNEKSYNGYDTSIQKHYNLTMDEFKLIEVSILSAVENTIKALRPERF